MTTSSYDYAGQSHSTAVISENEPIRVVPQVEILADGIILTIGDINMHLSTDSAIALSDIIVEGALLQMSCDFEEDFTQ